jgi:hypothetical protein
MKVWLNTRSGQGQQTSSYLNLSIGNSEHKCHLQITYYPPAIVCKPGRFQIPSSTHQLLYLPLPLSPLSESFPHRAMTVGISIRRKSPLAPAKCGLNCITKTQKTMFNAVNFLRLAKLVLNNTVCEIPKLVSVKCNLVPLSSFPFLNKMKKSVLHFSAMV